MKKVFSKTYLYLSIAVGLIVSVIYRWSNVNNISWSELATGLSTLGLVIVFLIGFFILLPKSVEVLKREMSIKMTKGWKRFWYDLHIGGGVYITGWLLMLCLTGLMWSFSWYKTGVYSLLGVDSAKIEIEASSSSKVSVDFRLWSEVTAELERE